jgi:membrane protein YqaA with SNARE-associated domain
MSDPGEKGPTRFRLDRKLLLKAGLGLGVILAISYICGVFFREPIIYAGKTALERFGLAGIFCAVIVTDASPLPLTNEPLIFLALGAEVTARTIFWVISAASVTAGMVGYGAGRLLGDGTRLGKWLREKYPGFDAFMQRYGAYGVAICALLPIPFSLSTWTAGMMRIRVHEVFAACLMRIPKTAFYVWLIAQGWAAGAG